MNILLISYNFGSTASGIVTYRVAKQFIAIGHQVSIVTSVNGTIENDLNIIECKPLVPDNSFIIRLSRWLIRTFLKDSLEYNYLWRYRAYKKCKSLIKECKYDLVYCRTTPIDSCYVGDRLKREFDVKLLQHFADPVPSIYSTKNCWRLSKLKRDFRDILRRADYISFGTQEMLDYQLNELNFDFSNKAFVSPDSASSGRPVFISRVKHDSLTLLYLGGFGDQRNPFPLFEAVRQMNDCGERVDLLVYSNKPRTLNYSNKYIFFLGRTNDVMKALAECDICIDLDIIADNSVFISSKIKDYLLINRPILLITKDNSPTYKLCRNCRTIFSTYNCSDMIVKCLMSINKEMPVDNEYTERESILNYFSPSTIVNSIIEKTGYRHE